MDLRTSILNAIRRVSPKTFYYLLYWRASRRLGDQIRRKEELFSRLVSSSYGKRCLQIGVRDRKYAPHWTSVDLYDQADYIDFHDDIHDLHFACDEFDIVVCEAVLEHVTDPPRAIEELRRVLKPGGEIWVVVPFNQPYHPSPGDYWRVTPDGLRLWMKGFSEIASGYFADDKSPIYNSCYYQGRKG